MTGLRRIAQKILSAEAEVLYDFTAMDQLTLLCCGNDEEALNERAYGLTRILRHELRELCPVITTVIGQCVHRLGAISEAYGAAAGLLKKIGGVSAGQVISVNDTAQITADIVEFSGPFGEDFQQRLLRARPEDAPGLLQSVLDAPEGRQLDSMLMRYYALIDLMKIAVHMMTRCVPGLDEREAAARLSGQFDIFATSGSLEGFRRTAEGLLTAALAARQDAPAETKYGHVIGRAEEYVRENFNDPNISLISTARHVGMSAAHFSTVFSQTLGRPFIHYLTDLRIERAKELLRTTNMRLADIALEVGYNEPNYFSQVFRKAEGMTPKEYRSREAGQ